MGGAGAIYDACTVEPGPSGKTCRMPPNFCRISAATPSLSHLTARVRAFAIGPSILARSSSILRCDISFCSSLLGRARRFTIALSKMLLKSSSPSLGA